MGEGTPAHHLGVCGCVCVCVDGVGFSPPKRTASSLGSQQQPRTHPPPPPPPPHHTFPGPRRERVAGKQGEPDYGGNNYEDDWWLMASFTHRAHTRTH